MCVCICMVARVHVCVRVSVECKRAEGCVREKGQTILKGKNFKDAENFMLASFALDDTLKSDQALEMAPRLFDHWKLAHT